MPRSAALILAGAALIAVGVVVFALRFLTPPEEPPPPAGAVGASGGSGVDAALDAALLEQVIRRLDRLEEKVFQPRLAPRDPSDLLASLDERLRVLEERPVSPARAATAVAATATAAAPEEEPTPEDLRAMSKVSLVARARALAQRQAKAEAVPYWREVLARGADDEVLIEANLELGYALRGAEKHAEEEAYFQEAMRIAGVDSEQGQWANYQIAWSEHVRDDFAAARDRMAEVANSRCTARDIKGHANLYVARFSLKIRDEARAREALEAIVREFGDSKEPADAWFTEQATTRLKQLDDSR